MWGWESRKERAKWAWDAWLEWVFPRTCVACGCYLNDRRGGYSCEDCRRRIAWILQPFCDRCGVPFYGKAETVGTCPACLADPPVFDQCRSLFLHRQTGSRIIHSLKYEQGLWLQAELTALFKENRHWESYFSRSHLVPVPLHAAKERSRGYNQSMIIAKAIAAAFPGVGIHDCLKRIRKTPSQTFLSREARLRNMEGAFAGKSCLPLGKRMVLVDDVLTTGATLNAAAAALHEGGAIGISAFTLAHG